MKGLCIFSGIVLLLILFSFVRLGTVVEYSAEGLVIRVRVGLFRFTVYPMKKKEKKSKARKAKEKQARETEEEAPKTGGTLSAFREVLPQIANVLGQFKRKLQVDKLYLDYTAAASDPAAAALAFGRANAAVGMIWPVFEQNLNVKERRIRTYVDFHQAEPVIYVLVACSLTIGQMIALAIGALKVFLQFRNQQKKQKEAV